MQALLNSRIAQIEKFDVGTVKTLGDLVYQFQILTETIIHLEEYTSNHELLQLLTLI